MLTIGCLASKQGALSLSECFQPQRQHTLAPEKFPLVDEKLIPLPGKHCQLLLCGALARQEKARLVVKSPGDGPYRPPLGMFRALSQASNLRIQTLTLCRQINQLQPDCTQHITSTLPVVGRLREFGIVHAGGPPNQRFEQ